MAGLGKFHKLRSRRMGRGTDLKWAVVSGAAANTNIAISGLRLDAQILAVIMVAAGVPSDVGSEVVIASAGNIQLTTTNSTGNKLMVMYEQPR